MCTYEYTFSQTSHTSKVRVRVAISDWIATPLFSLHHHSAFNVCTAVPSLRNQDTGLTKGHAALHIQKHKVDRNAIYGVGCGSA